MIKLIIADLDGTLYNNNKISKETFNTIHQLREDGYIFTIATGRHFTGSTSIINQLEVEGPVVCSNGAYVGIPSEDTVLKEEIIDTHLVMDVINKLNETNTTFLLYTSKRIVGTQASFDALYKNIGPFPAHVVEIDEVPLYVNEGIVKILIIEENESIYTMLYDTFIDYTEVSVVSSKQSFIDIGSKQSSKGSGLQTICDYYKINIDDVLAIGDMNNDISMIKAAGVGVAMGNGSEMLKKSADYVTDTIEKEGFSKAIKHYIYSKS